MAEILDLLRRAGTLVAAADPALREILLLSLEVSLAAVVAAAVIGIPIGTWLALTRLPGRGAIAAVFGAFAGTPPVVVGLIVYLLLSRSGPLGVLQLLYTPTAIVIAQALLVLPIIVTLVRNTMLELNGEYEEYMRSLGLGTRGRLGTLIGDGRPAILAALLLGFARAVSEVGAVMIVGGNIEHVTRVLSSAALQETTRGNFALAVALGCVLLAISLVVNLAAYLLAPKPLRRRHG